MKKFDDYEFQIEWIENIESITEDDKKKLYELRTLNKRRKTHQNWIKKNQKVYDEYKRREKLIKELEKEEKEVFDDVSLLKKVIIPTISIYKKDESSKSLKDKINHYKRKTYKGEPLKRRYVWYCTVRMRTLTKFQKNIYLGSTEKVEKVLNWYFDEKKFDREENNLKNNTMRMLMDFFKPNLMDGWENFSYKSLSLEKVIYPFLKDLKKKNNETN
jgi:hypothetical protein